MCAGVCFGDAEDFAKCNAKNPTVNCSSTGIGSSCFVAVGKYTVENGGAEKVGYVNGCMDCSGVFLLGAKCILTSSFSEFLASQPSKPVYVLCRYGQKDCIHTRFSSLVLV